MTTTVRDYLSRQFEIAWALTDYHLATLSDDECRWRPAARGLHVHEQADGSWRADWPEHEGYDLGPSSMAWLSWHLLSLERLQASGFGLQASGREPGGEVPSRRLTSPSRPALTNRLGPRHTCVLIRKLRKPAMGMQHPKRIAGSPKDQVAMKGRRCGSATYATRLAA